MAIVNRTPNSFSDGGATFALDAALSAALRAIDDGADWVDVGGVPFSPDTPEVSVAEEIDRVVPAVAARSDAVASIDTTRAEVAAAGIAAGASVVNDTSGVRDPAMAELLSEGRAAVVVAHSLAPPHEHLRRPQYDDVVADVAAFPRKRVEEKLTAARVAPERISSTPATTSTETPATPWSCCGGFRRSPRAGCPPPGSSLQQGLHRGDTRPWTRRPARRLARGHDAGGGGGGTAGARVVRTHQVVPTVDAVRLTEAVLALREPAFLRHNLPAPRER